jgi:hypothetical protein
MERPKTGPCGRETANRCFIGEQLGNVRDKGPAEGFGKRLKNCKVVQMNSGLHYMQEEESDAKPWLAI